MASRSAPANWRFTLLALAIAGLIGFAQWKGWLPEDARKSSPRESGAVVRPPTRPDADASPGSRKIGAWEELQGCTLVEDRGNDGDSFIVRHDGTDRTLRLYFADCPEKYRHQFNKDRIADQGRYFGGLTEIETIGIGEDARDFSLDLLRSAPFIVVTRWERVFDSERFYAFVTVKQGELIELLVSKGLARLHTKGGDRPGGSSLASAHQRLAGIERAAKAGTAGAWGKR